MTKISRGRWKVRLGNLICYVWWLVCVAKKDQFTAEKIQFTGNKINLLSIKKTTAGKNQDNVKKNPQN